MEKILILRLSSIGDILQASAVPRVLKKRFPGAQVHWVVRSDNAQLLQHHPHIDRLFSLDRRTGLQGLRELTATLQAERYTHVYDAHNNLRSHWLSWMVRAPHFLRRGKPRLRRMLLLWFKLPVLRDFAPIRSFITPLAPWGVVDDGEGSQMGLPPPAQDKARELLAAFPGGAEALTGNRWLAVAPSAAWPKKRWPLEHWKQLVQRLVQGTDFQVVVLGGPQDGFCAELAALEPARVLNLQGRTNLLESAAVTQQCRTLVAADTGLLHMAEALGKDVVGMLGPTPFGRTFRPRSRVLETDLWCRPCTKDGDGWCVNRVYQRCMVDITPAQVFQGVQALVAPEKEG